MEKFAIIKGFGEDFTPKHIFECGQCFRFKKEQDKSYTIVAKDRVINVSMSGSDVILKNATDEDVADIWYDYFDLSTDYSVIKKTLSADEHLMKSTAFGGGIRILNQDLWECIISFIISANNNIPRIQGIVERLCERYGEKISYNDITYYTFPSFEKLKDVKKENLQFLRAGYRDGYLFDAINKVNNKEVILEKITESSTEEAKNELLKIKGIGNKVADCILLFGARRRETFPVDVWVKRSISELYKDEIKDLSIHEFAHSKFSDLAGYAQQYLFYYMRENSAGGKTNG